MALHRDVAGVSGVAGVDGWVPTGRRYIQAVGIDHYREWRTLRNAVSDARGAAAAFEKLGFTALPPLINRAATSSALRELPQGPLNKLGPEDSLVVFFAGHGHSRALPLRGATDATGYLVPVDAPAPTDEPRGGLIELVGWLNELARLPPHHILVFLDACHSGIALDAAKLRYRGAAPTRDGRDALRRRRSRRVITSAFPDQLALDSGPVPGHSLFTGALIQLLGGELTGPTTGAELFHHLRIKLFDHPGPEQTPDFGEFPYHERGELVLDLPGPARPAAHEVAVAVARPTTRGHLIPRPVAPVVGATVTAALDRHTADRKHGAWVLSVLAGDGQATWAAWAARHGYLAVVVAATGHAELVASLLAQIPWARCLPGARTRFARAARLRPEAVDAAFASRAGMQRRRWLDHVTAGDPVARVAGWLIAAHHEPRAEVPDPATAPVTGTALVAALCELGAPMAVLLDGGEAADDPWLAAAIPTAAQLASELPGLAIGVTAPAEQVSRGLDRRGGAFSIARMGVIQVPALAPATAVRRDPAWLLHAALERDPRTTGGFELDAMVPVNEREREVPVDLLARDERIAVSLDDWFRAPDPDAYRRARVVDAWLQRAGVFIHRFVVDDVEARLPQIVDEIARSLAARRAEHPAPESHARHVPHLR